MLPGGRKSIEPMAARVQPDNVRSAHQSMHHLVAEAAWSDQTVLAAVAAEVLPELTGDSEPCIAAYGFPMLERLNHGKKNTARFKAPAVPADSRPRGARPDAASSAGLDHELPIQTHV